MDISIIKNDVGEGRFNTLARALTIVENDLEGTSDILIQLVNSEVPIVGITGPPGAGKSTLVNQLLKHFSSGGMRVGVLAVDPTSPFNYGSLLGDRIRMTSAFNNSNIYIRSVATRGSLGGMSAKTIEMADVLTNSGFDLVFIETVGVGQSEVEIAGLADLKVVVLVPESGDEIQHIKSGLMEIADIFVVNKSDRDVDGNYFNSLKSLLGQNPDDIQVLKTTAEKGDGITELANAIKTFRPKSKNHKKFLLFERAWELIIKNKVKGIDRKKLHDQIAEASDKSDFNLYTFIDEFISNS